MLRFLALACFLTFAASQDSQHDDVIWDGYKLRFHKSYGATEDIIRKDIFARTVAKIQQHNLKADLGLQSYRHGLTPFTNWGGCASCWAFSATGTVEGQHFAKTKKLVPLSEQNHVDCSWDEGNLGCFGGWPVWALQYIVKNKGIDTEKSYPYTFYVQKCEFNTSGIGATIKGYNNIKHKSEKALQDAIANIGPISVCIDGSHESCVHYQSGIYNVPRCSTTYMTNCLLAVGSGVESGKEYYIAKNSLGTAWGMNGYIWMSRNKDNQCGIATNASYPII